MGAHVLGMRQDHGCNGKLKGRRVLLQVSKEAEDLIKKILVADPDKRLSVEQIQVGSHASSPTPKQSSNLPQPPVRKPPQNRKK